MKAKYADIGSINVRCIEECAELIHILCKVERFGLEKFYPDKPEVKNWQLVLQEIEDVERLCRNIKKAINRATSEEEALRGGEVKDEDRKTD
uniref:Uncharacterized protein n=1 Tax=viral metagenome TaxID=1070528 RepID=A0A6H1ZKL8_9ZZZZ